MWNKIQRIYIGDHYQVYPKWKPWANTMGYYTFDDQNASQITDTSWNNRNLTWGTMPTYTLVNGTNYAWVFSNVSSSNTAPSYSYWPMDWDYTILCWVKPTANTASYVNLFYAKGGWLGLHQISLIWGYNSWQFEYFDDANNWTTKRTSIKIWASLNTWYLVGYTRNWTSVKTYSDWVNTNSITGNNTANQKTFYLWSSNGWDRFSWQIWDCVVENRVWTAQEIADYYNQTKASYLRFN